jgi:hypothetical protein
MQRKALVPEKVRCRIPGFCAGAHESLATWHADLRRVPHGRTHQLLRGLIWCLLSLVLGPIATFLIVVLGKVPADIE